MRVVWNTQELCWAQSPMSSKHLYLIRHAESINNVDKREARRAFHRLTTFQEWPSSSQWSSFWNLSKLDMDSELSPTGWEMVHKQRENLGETFLADHCVTLILHSHLVRAKHTCQVLFHDCGIPMVETKLLHEKSIWEHTLGFMSTRVERFLVECILSSEHEHIVLVGHSGFFRELVSRDPNWTGGSRKLKNCEVFHCLVHANGSIEAKGTLIEGGLSVFEASL